MHISVMFSTQHCHIQGPSLQTRIGTASPTKAATHLKLQPHDLDLWHCRLGHPSQPRLQLLHKLHPMISIPSHSHCHVCHLAKQKALPFTCSSSHASDPFVLVHMDIWGPFNTSSHDGFSYFLTVVDDFSRCTWIFLMKNKSETRTLVESFCVMVSTQFAVPVRTIRTDQGVEFKMDTFFASHGIIHQTSCVETAPQNGRVEFKHQHLLAVARSLHFQCDFPLMFWGECILHACYLINRIPTPILDNKSPFEVLYKRAPTYDQGVWIFGICKHVSSWTK
ncbi:Retrovirus-related Pol polyprotein from transposon RE1 [Linum grandiflorum]